ncbi:MAG: phage Gp37/Gp68 family protein [Proteobacteria bacterium]|nr:phage Gp37/Gp68 family protein [Pseudomonadota bacterium]
MNKAYQLTQENRQAQEKSRSVFNRTNDNVEWACWTWNPVTGCKHGCSYCYARDIAARFYKPEIGFNPHFYPERLSAPKNTPIPKSDDKGEHNVFTVSMGDLFGDWVSQEWINAVFKAIQGAPEWNFLLLTKNPKRYLTLDFPENVWVGATADTQARADKALKVFSALHAAGKRPRVLFLSMEPLSERILLPPKSALDWIIIGGQSQPGNLPTIQPEWEWVESLLIQAKTFGCRRYFKPNLTVVPKEYPE